MLRHETQLHKVHMIQVRVLPGVRLCRYTILVIFLHLAFKFEFFFFFFFFFFCFFFFFFFFFRNGQLSLTLQVISTTGATFVHNGQKQLKNHQLLSGGQKSFRPQRQLSLVDRCR